MATLPGLPADVYFGDVDKPLPDWRKERPADDMDDVADIDDEDSEPDAAELKALEAMSGISPGEAESWDSNEPAANPVDEIGQMTKGMVRYEKYATGEVYGRDGQYSIWLFSGTGGRWRWELRDDKNPAAYETSLQEGTSLRLAQRDAEEALNKWKQRGSR